MPAVGAGSVNLHQRTRDQADRNVESKWAQRQGRVEGGMVREGQLPRDRYRPGCGGCEASQRLQREIAFRNIAARDRGHTWRCKNSASPKPPRREAGRTLRLFFLRRSLCHTVTATSARR
jgi:hypothetical protein